MVLSSNDITKFGTALGMAAQVWSQVVCEPIVKEADSKADGPGLRVDLGIRGVWTPQVDVLFDIKVIDTDTCIEHQNQFWDSRKEEAI